LVAVHASGPRGDDARQRRTRTYPVAVQSGSFLVDGLLHAPPDVDPMTTFSARPAIVPLTDAWTELWSAGEHRIDLWSGTLIVNRDHAVAVWPVTEHDLAERLLRCCAPQLRERAPVAWAAAVRPLSPSLKTVGPPPRQPCAASPRACQAPGAAGVGVEVG
jgi:hypothetical protein